MQNGNAKVYPGNGKTLYANSETVFVVAESDSTGTTYTSYTGIKNAPSIDPKDSAVAEMVYYVRGNNLLGFVFVDATGCDVVNGRNDITFLAGKEGMSKLKTDSDNNKLLRVQRCGGRQDHHCEGQLRRRHSGRWR